MKKKFFLQNKLLWQGILFSVFLASTIFPSHATTIIDYELDIVNGDKDNWVVGLELELLTNNPPLLSAFCDSITTGCSDPWGLPGINSWAIYNGGGNIDLYFPSYPVKYAETGEYHFNIIHEDTGIGDVEVVREITVPSPIPEPATMLLLGTGLVGVAGAARRKKKNQA